MRTVLAEIQSSFQGSSNEDKRKQMSDYMRGQFDYYGLVSPIRRELSKPFLKELPKEPKEDLYLLIELLWQQPQREFHYIAQELFFKVAEKTLEKGDLDFIESLIVRNSWWDTIDFLAAKILKIYFAKFPEERNGWVDKCIASDNIWLKRSSLLLHLKQKEDADIDYMFETILRLVGSAEFFINKAIGWLLREYSKKHPEPVKDFIEKHKDVLSNLSIREGSKYL
ncbi:MAG: 3-methyladenine DNA glycosylase AlkD [Arenicella sp.]|jgi:3-methyladenine DNA glycosylase AlkD